MRCLDTCCRPESEIEYTVLRRAYPVAAKPHPCGECGGEIAVGEQHNLEVALVEGSFGSRRWHVLCPGDAWA